MKRKWLNRTLALLIPAGVAFGGPGACSSDSYGYYDPYSYPAYGGYVEEVYYEEVIYEEYGCDWDCGWGFDWFGGWF